MRLREIIREEIEKVTREVIREAIEEIALHPDSSDGKSYYPKDHKTIGERYKNWRGKKKNVKKNDAELEEEDDAFDDEDED